MILGIFVFVLLACVWLKLPILYALVFGYLLFAGYALRKGFRIREVLSMSFEGLRTAGSIVITMLLIGVMTGLWRGSGTIAGVVFYASRFVRPSMMLLSVFLLNSLISFLTGSSFATAATMGVISVTLANAMGVSPVLSGGAMLSGAYFGDRCSPVSTCAQLCAELTGTNIYENIVAMVKTSIVPFVLTVAAFFLLGTRSAAQDMTVGAELFQRYFVINGIVLIPAILILVLAVFRLPIRLLMMVSIGMSALICLFVQGMRVPELLQTMVFGYRASAEEIGVMMNGGGIQSMISVALIVGISSTYAGIFRATGLLTGIQNRLRTIPNPTLMVTFTALITSAVACNQTLATMLTYQLCENQGLDRKELMIQLENTVVLIAGLLPWSIAGTIPLATVGAPVTSLLASVYLYAIPICWLARSFSRK